MSQLQNVILNVAGFKEALFDTLSATEVSLISLLCNLRLPRREVTRYCNPLRDIGPAYEIAKDVEEYGFKVILVGTDASYLVERVRHPMKSWRTGQVHYPLVLWGAVVPVDDDFDVDGYFDVCHYFEDRHGTHAGPAAVHAVNYSTQLTFSTLHGYDGVSLTTCTPSAPYEYKLVMAVPMLGSIANVRGLVRTAEQDAGGAGTPDGETRGRAFAVSTRVGPDTYEVGYMDFREGYLLGQLVGILDNNDLFTRVVDSQSDVPAWTCAIADVRDPAVVDNLRHSTMTRRAGGGVFRRYVDIFIDPTVNLNFYTTTLAVGKFTRGLNRYSIPNTYNFIGIM